MMDIEETRDVSVEVPDKALRGASRNGSATPSMMQQLFGINNGLDGK